MTARSNSPPINRRQRAYRSGLWAERLAEFCLRLKGHRVHARRYKTVAGEIDLIVERKGVIAAVEVKARPAIDAGIEAVSYTARRRIEKAAMIFIAQNPHFAGHAVRFDIIAVSLKRGWRPFRLTHIRNAWEARI